jgi:hypothetical protein
MLSLLLSLALFSQVTIEIEPLPPNELPPAEVKIDTPCDVAEKSCRESAISAQETMRAVHTADWTALSDVMQGKARKAAEKGAFTGQIGFYYMLIADMQLRLDDEEAATESYRTAKKYFVEADDLLHEALEILTPPEKTTGV